MRTVKDPKERRNEILDAAEELFLTKGYAKTTITDILRKVDIAKGTFYYYFESKEEVMEDVLDRITKKDIERAQQIAKNDNLDACEKMIEVLMAQKGEENTKKEDMKDFFDKPGNKEMHYKSLEISIKYLVPIMEDIVKQGINEGTMQTKFPKEVMQIALTTGTFVFDANLFKDSEDKVARRIHVFVESIEKMLNMEKGSLESLIGLMMS